VATIAFDLNGTLLDAVAVLGEPHGGPALDAAVAQAMALTVTGTYRPFTQLLEAGLRVELEKVGRDPRDAPGLVANLEAMPAFPEAGEALDALEQAGHRLAVVTNSAADTAEEVLRHNGLLDRLAAVVSVDEVGAYKPDPRVYAHALERLGSAADETWLVAAHWWDVLGAGRAGLRTAWVARKERVLLPTVVPDVRGDDLRAAAGAIIAAAR